MPTWQRKTLLFLFLYELFRLVLSQLGRRGRGEYDMRPKLSDFWEIEADVLNADSVMLMYRPEYYGISVDEDGNSLRGIAYIIVAK